MSIPLTSIAEEKTLKEEPLIPDNCAIRVASWLKTDPGTKFRGVFYVNNGVVTADKGVYEGHLEGGNSIVGGWRGEKSWCEEKILFYPDGTSSVSPIWHTCVTDKNGGTHWETKQYFFSGTWQLVGGRPEQETKQPADLNIQTQPALTEPPSNTIGPDQELKSVGQFEGQEGWIATPINPNANEMTLPNMRTYIDRLIDGYKTAKEMYQDAKAQLKQLQDEESYLRVSIPAWESQEKSIDSKTISEKIKAQHDQIKDIDQQYQSGVQQAIIDQKAPDPNSTGELGKLGITETKISDIEKRNESFQTKVIKAGEEIKTETRDVKDHSFKLMELQDTRDANKAFAEKQILELNDQLKRKKELNRKIDEGKARLEKLQPTIENAQEKVNNYLAVCQQGRETLRQAYEQYKALEKNEK